MTPYKFIQMDVFSRRSGMGNALAVIPDSFELSDSSMQSIARWTRLAETTFTSAVSSDETPPQSSYRIRMFAPNKEVPFAGHPSVGTAAALLDLGIIVPDAQGLVWQHGLAGVLPLKVSHVDNPAERTIALRNPAANPVAKAPSQFEAALAAATANLALGDIPTALMQGGRQWWVVNAQSETALRTWSPNWDAIADLATASESMGICAYAFADPDQGYQVVTRALVGQHPTFEDAASGAANAVLASYLFAQAIDQLPGDAYVVSQGREIGSDAKLFLSRDAQGAIWSGGQTCTAVVGTINWQE